MKNTAPLLRLSYFLRQRKDYNYYLDFKKSENLSISALEENQINNFKSIFSFAKKSVPYYSNLFTKLKLQESDFNSLSDLEKLPILTKEIIRANYNDFFPKNYNKKFVSGSTGGSTGAALKYRMSIDDYSRGIALLYRGLGYGGYTPGDKIAILAGGSLVKNQSSITSRINYAVLNYKKFSSYGIDTSDLESYYNTLKQWQPKFLRGYASSLALLAEYCLKHDKKIEFQSVFSTAEMLLPTQRKLIKNAFKTKVYNNYGLNDGGVSAYESGDENEFIIDTERSILEVVADNDTKNVFDKTGRIVATSLYNYAFPFIRYDTGDYGTQRISNTNQQRKILTDLKGRTTDYITINGKTIGSPVLTILMGKTDVLKYQIIQKKDSTLQIRVLKGDNYSKIDEDFIKESLTSNLGDVSIDIVYTSDFIFSDNKHKFIIRE